MFRKVDRFTEPAARRPAEIERSTIGIDDVPADREPQAPTGTGFVEAYAPFCDLFQTRVGDARSVVGDFKNPVILVLANNKLDLAVPVLARVVDQITQQFQYVVPVMGKYQRFAI